MKLPLLALAAATFALANSATAAIVSLQNDSGSLKLQTFVPPAITSGTLTNPYGAPPLPPVTTLSNGLAMSFIVTSDFLASANTNSGGKITTMNGDLVLLVSFPTQVSLTTTVLEDGIWSKTGTGTVDVSGQIKVEEADHGNSPLESHTTAFGSETYDPSGTWKLQTTAATFAGGFFTYKITIDNTLVASALATQGTGSALIAKKDFTLLLTTDGAAGGPVAPEPATLGVLGMGSLALLARRRRR